MLSVLAASAVTQKGIQTLWPLQVNPGQLSPLTKLVVGRGVTMCRRPVQILWTVSEFDGLPNIDSNAHDAEGLHINHFVPLVEVIGQCDVTVNLDGHCSAPPNTDVGESPPTESRENNGVVDVINLPVDSHSSDHFQSGPCNGIPLTENHYLSFAECIRLLSDVDESQMVPIIPAGVKSNMYFIVSAADNEQRVYCGAWANVRGYNSVVVENNPKELYKKMAKYVIVSALLVRTPSSHWSHSPIVVVFAKSLAIIIS